MGLPAGARALALAAARAGSRVAWALRPRGAEPPSTGARVPVLCYHRVLPGYAERGAPAYSVTPEQFAAQMRWLCDRGFTSLSLDEYLAAARGGLAVPERAVLVTFDDGYADVGSVAWPIAREYGVRLALFACTGLLDGARPPIYPVWTRHMADHAARRPDLWRALTWAELRALHGAGLGVGFHTHGHARVASLPRGALAADVAFGLARLEGELGVRARAFAFPKGDANSYNPEGVSTLRAAGLECLFTTRAGRTALPHGGGLAARLVVHHEDDLVSFGLKVLGAYDWVGHARAAVGGLRAAASAR